jgi:hypothetical protein
MALDIDSQVSEATAIELDPGHRRPHLNEGAFLIGNGQISRIIGERGTTPECPEAKFKKRDVVRVRRLKHLKHLPVMGAVAAVVPPGFSPDWAWADLCGKPRALMCRVPARGVTYIVAFEGDPTPHLLREAYLLPTSEPPAEIGFTG